MFDVIAGERTDAVRTQKLIFIEHAGENSAQPIRAYQGSHAAPSVAKMTGARGVDALHQLRHVFQALGHNFRHVVVPRCRCQGSITVVAQRGNNPTMERTFSRFAVPSGNRNTS